MKAYQFFSVPGNEGSRLLHPLETILHGGFIALVHQILRSSPRLHKLPRIEGDKIVEETREIFSRNNNKEGE